MNESFINTSGGRMIFTDKGIECHHDLSNQHFMFPYGSMSDIKSGFLGIVTIKGGAFTFSYAPTGGDQKKKLKEVIDLAQKLNASAPKCEACVISLSNKEMGKTLESVIEYFGGLPEKRELILKEAFANVVSSMSEEEKPLIGVRGSGLYINKKLEVDGNNALYIIITTRKFYYVGAETNAFSNNAISGSIDLKDVHAISLGKNGFGTPYIQFEVKNDNYVLETFSNTNEIKNKLEEGIKSSAEKTTQAPTTVVVQSALSPAEELKKLKELLDLGIITNEEFDAKKKQLLGL